MKQWILLALSLMLLVLPLGALAQDVAPAGETISAEAPGDAVSADTSADESTASPAEETPLTLNQSLMYMLQGMVGIFLVTGLIILVLVILERATRKHEA